MIVPAIAAARAAGVTVTRIGAFAPGRGVVLTVDGRPVAVASKGYAHF